MKEVGIYSLNYTEIYDMITNYLSTITNTSNSIIWLSAVWAIVIKSLYCNEYLIEVFLVLSTVDYLLGTYISIKHKKFNFKKNLRWIVKLITYLSTICLTGVLLHTTYRVFHTEVVKLFTELIMNTTMLIIIFAESTSILENGRVLKLPIPKIIYTVVVTLSRKINKNFKDDLKNIDIKKI